jgi:hypothetical protein
VARGTSILQLLQEPFHILQINFAFHKPNPIMDNIFPSTTTPQNSNVDASSARRKGHAQIENAMLEIRIVLNILLRERLTNRRDRPPA